MPAFHCHKTMLEHCGNDCDALCVDAVAGGVQPPVVFLFDLLDPMAREMVVLMELIDRELAERSCKMAVADGKPLTLVCDLPQSEALRVLANMPDDERAPLEQPPPEGQYLLVVFGAGSVACHLREIVRQQSRINRDNSVPQSWP